MATTSGTRERLQALVRNRPGISLVEVVRSLDVGRSTVRYHLEKLADAGNVTVVRHGATTVLYPDRTRAARRMHLLNLAPSQELLALIERHPGTGTSQLAKQLGLSPERVRRHLGWLEDAALVSRGSEYHARWRLGPGSDRTGS